MIEHISDCVVLANGVHMPWLGLGVSEIPDGEPVIKSVCRALEAGYRSIDTATIYGNERGVGRALRECGIPREEVFLTTKVWNSDQRAGRVLEAFGESLERLGVMYVDLYLVHWPVKEKYKDTWKVVEQIYRLGGARAIGVSNFLVHHLVDLLETAEIAPMVNQVEYNPWLRQPELHQFCIKKQIQMEAWSPLGQGKILTNPTIIDIANQYNKTPAQMLIRWDLQHQVVSIPKSSRPQRIIENAHVFDFNISEEDMARIDHLDEGQRVGDDPDNFNF